MKTQVQEMVIRKKSLFGEVLYLMACAFVCLCFQSCADEIVTFDNGYVRYKTTELSTADKDLVKQIISENEWEGSFDVDFKMISRELEGWQYHIDSPPGTIVHDVRASFGYARQLLNLGDTESVQRAIAILEKTVPLQDKDVNSKTCGVWPYFPEEPLATKIAPTDYNWADFNATTLLDIYMENHQQLPDTLVLDIEKSLVLAAKSIKKRDIGWGYTNISLMGSYVTYMVSHMFNLEGMQTYSINRFQKFYEQTLNLGGFLEYNSPTYNKVALDIILQMKEHIVEPSVKVKIDSMYAVGWDMIARHYHKPTMQWSGPHSRSYATLLKSASYSFLREATKGVVNHPNETASLYDINNKKHQVPSYLIPYFEDPVYPRLERDTIFEGEPEIVLTSYLTDDYVISSASFSTMWNQRRPLLAYWGTPEQTKYLQLRFLHDGYDFCTATLYSQQKDNKILAAINMAEMSGDKHPLIHIIEDGKFKAKDLRLRFEFGNVALDNLTIPTTITGSTLINIEGVQWQLHMVETVFDANEIYWEKGQDINSAWLDLVIFNGKEAEFDLSEIEKAFICFGLEITTDTEDVLHTAPEKSITDGIMKATWDSMQLKIPVVPTLPKNQWLWEFYDQRK